MALMNYSSFPGSKEGLERNLGKKIREDALGLQVQVEFLTMPAIMHFANHHAIVFKVATTVNEQQYEQEFGLPFQIRLKALLKLLVYGLPEAYQGFTWSVPNGDSDDKVPLTFENLEQSITFKELFATQGSYPHACRFVIHATETMESMLARK